MLNDRLKGLTIKSVKQNSDTETTIHFTDGAKLQIYAYIAYSRCDNDNSIRIDFDFWDQDGYYYKK